MADDDIVVRIGADTSDLDAKMARAQQMMQQGFTPLPQGLGGPPQSLLELATEKAKTQTTGERDAAVRKYSQAAKEATGATNQLSEAEDGLTASTERAASGFERMVGRMLTRLAVFGLLFEAIRLLKEAFSESGAYEAATVRWETLTRGAEGYGASLEDIKRISDETGISRQDLMGVEGEWKKVGVATDVAGASLENISEYAKILGVDVKTVAEEFARVELKRGSIKDMQDLAYATHDANLQRLVNDLAEAQRMAPILAQQMAEIDRQTNRAADDQDRALKRAIEDAERLRNAQLSVAQAIGMAGEAYKEFIHGGRRGGPGGEATERLKSEMALGERQLAKEGEPTVQQMRAMGVSGKEIYQILMQAAQRYHEQVRINLQRQEEDQKRTREQAQEDARTNVRLTAAQDLLKAEGAVAQAVEQGVGANTAFAAQMATAEGQSDLIKQHIKDVVDDAKGINTAIKDWNTGILNFIDNLSKAGKAADKINEVFQTVKEVIQAVSGPGKEGQPSKLEQLRAETEQKLTHPESPLGKLGQWFERKVDIPVSQRALESMKAPDWLYQLLDIPKRQDSDKKQDDKKQDETNKTLSMIHNVLQNAFA